MACVICGRGACCRMFHSLEEQEAFEPAQEAYDKYLKIREKCEKEYRISKCQKWINTLKYGKNVKKNIEILKKRRHHEL